MDTIEKYITNYLEYCNTQKCPDEKTLKAYRIDLRQFFEKISNTNITEITSDTLEQYIAKLHEQYKPKTVKRKIISLPRNIQEMIFTHRKAPIIRRERKGSKTNQP